MESSISFHNNLNEVKNTSKQRSDSIPVEKINTKELNFLTIEDLEEKLQSIRESNSNDKKSILSQFNKQQLIVLSTLAYGNFWIAACVSLQAPFFPKEAESKGATSTQYGLVFGIYELMIFIFSPLFGKMITWVSPKFLCIFGFLGTGLSTIMFGLLDRAPFGTSFIYLAFALRIIEGIASAAFMTASYTVVAKEFPNRIASTFSILETYFGFGLILGPTVGGALCEMKGFETPFVVLGIFLMLGAVITFIFMTNYGESKTCKSGNIIKFMSDFGLILNALAIVTSLVFTGFNSATLEPHLRQFSLNPIKIGFIFVVSASIFAMTSPLWGKLCDLGFNPKILCIVGCILCSIGFVFIGPLNCISVETKLWLTIISLALIGTGIAAKLVTAFVSALHDSIIRRGFPDDISTYGLVSAMFFSCCSVGSIIGPALGGFLLERIGYKNSILIILIEELLLILMVSIHEIWRKYSINTEKEQLIKNYTKFYSYSQSSNETIK